MVTEQHERVTQYQCAAHPYVYPLPDTCTQRVYWPPVEEYAVVCQSTPTLLYTRSFVLFNETPL